MNLQGSAGRKWILSKKRISDNINEKEQELEHERLKEQDKNNYELQNMFNKLNAFDELYNDLLKRTKKLEYNMADALNIK